MVFILVFCFLLFLKTSITFIAINFGFFEGSIAANNQIFFFYWSLILIIGTVISMMLYEEGCKHHDKKSEYKEGAGFVGGMFIAVYILLFLGFVFWPDIVISISIAILIISIIASIITLSAINPEFSKKLFAGIFLVIQVLLIITIMIAMGSLEMIREMLGLPSHEQSLVVFLGFWGICIGLVTIGSFFTFFSDKNYPITIFVGLGVVLVFVVFLLILVFRPELAFFITFSIII